jgi:hypothetical protein
LGHGKESLEHIGRVVILNMGMGLLTRGIDNWGHVSLLILVQCMKYLRNDLT